MRGWVPAGWRGGGDRRLRARGACGAAPGRAELRSAGREALAVLTHVRGVQGPPGALGAVPGPGRGDEVSSRDAVTAPSCLLALS